MCLLLASQNLFDSVNVATRDLGCMPVIYQRTQDPEIIIVSYVDYISIQQGIHVLKREGAGYKQTCPSISNSHSMTIQPH